MRNDPSKGHGPFATLQYASWHLSLMLQKGILVRKSQRTSIQSLCHDQEKGQSLVISWLLVFTSSVIFTEWS
jgi:hypothetical protein